MCWSHFRNAKDLSGRIWTCSIHYLFQEQLACWGAIGFCIRGERRITFVKAGKFSQAGVENAHRTQKSLLEDMISLTAFKNFKFSTVYIVSLLSLKVKTSKWHFRMRPVHLLDSYTADGESVKKLFRWQETPALQLPSPCTFRVVIGTWTF